jgi:hypothetical protein
MLATIKQAEVKKMPYWLNVFIAIDQLGNAIAGGNPDNTISGRVGFFASDLHISNIKGYWKALDRMLFHWPRLKVGHLDQSFVALQS